MESHPFRKHINPAVGLILSCLNLDKRYVKADGCFLWDDKDNKYLDMLAGYGTMPFGFNHPDLWQAINRVQQNLEPVFAIPSMLEVGTVDQSNLIDIISGAESAEAAIKLARSSTGRHDILSTWNGFHGKTLGALSATGKPQYQHRFGAPAKGFNFVTFGDLTELEQAFQDRSQANNQFAAFMIEPIQGEGGVHVPPPGYLKKVRQLCDQYEVLLIIGDMSYQTVLSTNLPTDEVQTGLGRTGSFLACQYGDDKIVPDILMLAKALGGGLLPIGAILYTEKVYNEYYAFKHSSTFAGNTLSTRVGAKVLELLEKDNFSLVHKVDELGKWLISELEELRNKFPLLVKEVRGRGFLIGVEFTSKRQQVPLNRPASRSFLLGLMSEQELLAGSISSYLLNKEGIRAAVTLSSSNTLRIEPPLIATKEMCERLSQSMLRSLHHIEQSGSVALLQHLVSSSPNRTNQHNQQNTSHNELEQRVPMETDVACIINPLTGADYISLDPSLQDIREIDGVEALDVLAERLGHLLEPFTVHSVPGVTTIYLPRTESYVSNADNEAFQGELYVAIELARSFGIKRVAFSQQGSIQRKINKEKISIGFLEQANEKWFINDKELDSWMIDRELRDWVLYDIK